MSGFNVANISSVENCQSLALCLRELDKTSNVRQNLYLENILERVFRAGGFRVDVRKESLTGVAKALESLSPDQVERVNRVLLEEMGAIDEATEKDLQNAVVPTAQLEQLLKEYEEHLKNGMSPGEALEKITEANKGIVARSQIEDLIRRQSEAYQKIVDDLREVSAESLGEETIKELAKKTATEVAVSSKELEIEIKAAGQSVPSIVVEKLAEELKEVGVQRILENNISRDGFDKKVEKAVEEVSQDLTKQIIKQYAEGAKTRIELQVDIRKRAFEITDNLLAELQSSDPILAGLVEKAGVGVRMELADRINQEIILGLSVPGQLEERVVSEISRGTPSLGEEQVERVEMAVKSIRVQVTSWTENNKIELTKPQGDWFERNIVDSFVGENGQLQINEWRDVRQYAKLVRQIYYPSDGNQVDAYKNESMELARSRNQSPGKIDNAWNDLRGLTAMLRMKPAELNNFINNYRNAQEKLKGLNLPFKVGECRALDGLIKAIESSPQTRNFLIYAQKYIALNNSINKIGATILTKIGAKEVALKMVGKLGGQAMVEFTKNALVVFAEHGTTTGLKLILKGIVTGGVKAGAAGAGAGAGASGGVAAAVAAFQALPVVGQVILLVVGAVVLIKSVVAPLVKKIKKVLGSLNLELGMTKFFKENFGNFVGGILNGAVKVGMVVVGMPALIIGTTMTAFLTPVLIIFFAVFVLYQFIFLPNLISSIVPPRYAGSGAGEEIGDGGFTPSEPIYSEDCDSSPACAIIEHILHDLGYQRAVGRDTREHKKNVDEIASKLRNWDRTFPDFPSFNLNRFVEIMISNSTNNTSGRPYFQCLGFSLAADLNLPRGREISHYMAGNHPGCISVDPKNAGVGDHIMYMGPHIMILSVLNSPDEYGKKSGVISDVNYDYEGAFRNRYFPDFDEFFNSLKSNKGAVKILRCK